MVPPNTVMAPDGFGAWEVKPDPAVAPPTTAPFPYVDKGMVTPVHDIEYMVG